MGPIHTAEGDAFALAMIAVLVCGMGVVVMILFTIFRNAAKRSSDVDELSDDVWREKKDGEAGGENKRIGQ